MFLIIVYILSVMGMEFVAWFSHKYVMHGWLWSWHRDHHQKERKVFERNDLFFLMYALPAMVMIIGGIMLELMWLQVIGFGITTYGSIYFLLHDVYIHGRFFKLPEVDSTFFRAIKKAHLTHHANTEKREGENFGLLLPYLKMWLNRER